MKIVLVAGCAAALLAGCADNYSPSCKHAVPLTSPWTGFGLPVDEGRVCSSSADEAHLEFTSGTKDARMAALEARILAQGYTKKECKSDFCVYVKDKARVTLHGMDAHKWKTFILRSK